MSIMKKIKWDVPDIDSAYDLKYKKEKRGKETIPVTVCIVAMFDENSIIGASDRMLTSADIQFEPQQSKILQFTNSIFTMVAGDSSFQYEIIQKVKTDVVDRVLKEPDNWWDILDVVDLYIKYYSEERIKKSEIDVLSPLGLNRDSFISRQNEMDSSFIRHITTELVNYELPRICTIFAGIDQRGAHIYVAENEHIQCLDNVGFAAIGAGFWHASSQMMFAGHTKNKSFAETLLLVYSAKKRAEVAPGVGECTDMFVVGPGLGRCVPAIGEHVLGELKKIYESEQKREQRAKITANQNVKKYVDDLLQKGITTKDQAVTVVPDSGGETSG